MHGTTYYNSGKHWKWYSVTEWVDIDTGEVIPKWLKERDYRIVDTEIVEEKFQTHGNRIIRRLCKIKEQLKLEL